jgi:hypothetical protein
MTPEEFYANARAHADDEGRLPLSRMTGWEIFPFEAEGLIVVPLAPPVLPEPPRWGEDPAECRACREKGPEEGRWLWSDDQWQIALFESSGAPLVFALQSRDHYDFPTLPDDLAGSLGRLLVHLTRAIESLPHIARAHVSRWGDGGAHLHMFVYGRPAGFSQLRGTCLAIWDDLLPAMPAEIQRADADVVVRNLVDSFGGTAALRQ